ncbi:HAD superfamily hydrolase (TIGR01509 family)/HAD superfamily hydrolase (TIGR01549 family) [Nonomuraea polychroma]|uniref:HAD superfamily hydrolase (TIGR01509 family)/HAD superfamily hydrolase (TIGR01549 family) n=1 Tax=Nonomuraea polychroma TaxID=46176 RepID=A0A438M286_9ACTN|nr:HAD family hydrolase [Nonomuraea polychroma]RVX39940.1 HAD superfamily hydrolase (TIGR01509 family)/HAD superfamily hydrolase (TIGR01549 family) [Nonomuraea polychroma]
MSPIGAPADETPAAPVHAGSEVRHDHWREALLAKAQERVPVVLVTNATDTLDEHLDRIGLTHFADAVVSSATVGVAKPDQHIYEIAAELAGAAPERCLFVDDRLENVEAARTVGSHLPDEVQTAGAKSGRPKRLQLLRAAGRAGCGRAGPSGRAPHPDGECTWEPP